MSHIFIPYLSFLTGHILLGLVLIWVPPTSYLRALLLPVLIIPPIITAFTAEYASSVKPFNFIFGVGYGPRLVMEIFDLVCVSKRVYNVEDGDNDGIAWYTRFNKSACWALDLMFNKREIGHPGQVKYVPRGSDKIVSKRSFMIFRSIRFVCFYLLLDFLSLQSLEDVDVKFAPGKERMLKRMLERDLPGADLGEIIGGVIGFGAAGSLLLFVLHDFLSLCMVGLGVSRVADWPPIFGSVTDLYSVRRLWG